ICLVCGVVIVASLLNWGNKDSSGGFIRDSETKFVTFFFLGCSVIAAIVFLLAHDVVFGVYE
ncbi:MAG: hypothetical protein NTY09_01530, partial [bacterium]|nr:hypothetical protein [bacterium]